MADKAKVTYGDSVSRRTRTPIKFDPSLEGSGLYQSPSLLSLLSSKLFSGLGATPNAQITVNPFDPDATSVSNTIRHEDIHALLDGLNLEPQRADNYYDVVRGLLGRAGSRREEVPAYMGAFEPTVTRVDPVQRDSFVKSFARQIAAQDPKKAKIYLDIASYK